MNTNFRSLLATLVCASFVALAAGCTAPVDESEDEPAVDEAVQAIGVLSLVRERKISSLFNDSTLAYEASGVQVLGGDLYVIFDSMDKVAKIPTALNPGTASYMAGTLSSSTKQYEGITFDSNATQHFYVVQEVSPAMVVQLDGAGSAQGEVYQSTGVSFASQNKGFEGIAWLRRNNVDYLLALCEAGNCGSQTGTASPGMIKVLKQSGSSWSVETTISLCATESCTGGFFDDYSDIALLPLADGSLKVAITSQESSQLWVGTLAAASWTLSGGTIYDFPGSGYCNVEGVTFLGSSQIAVVSDQYSGSDAACLNKDESVHVFNLP